MEKYEFEGFKLTEENIVDFGMEEEYELVSKEMGTKELAIIAGYGTDETTIEEIWDETEVGLPKRSNEHRRLELEYPNGRKFFMTVWDIQLTEDIKGVLTQDASPLGIFLKVEDAERFGVKLNE